MKLSIKYFHIFVMASLMAMLMAVPTHPVRAATVIVNTLLDENDGSCVGGCSLREAINAANPNDTISFSVTGTIVLTNGELNITKNLTVSGPGAGNLSVSGNDVTRVFNVSGSTVTATITDLAIKDGFVVDGAGAGVLAYDISSLTLDHVTISDNIADTGSGYPRGGGVAIDSGGALIIRDSVISGNSSDWAGGGVAMMGSTTLTMENVTLDDNHVTFGPNGSTGGGGISFEVNDGYDSTLTNVIISDGSSVGYGGGIYNGGADLTIEDSAISGNSAMNNGGGIFNQSDSELIVINSTISGNSSDNGGGGIFNYAGATLIVSQSTFSSNTAGGYGGGVVNSSGTATITNSTFESNTANVAYGGGLYQTGSLATSTLRNNTLSGNSAMAGGGIMSAQGSMSLYNTISANNTNGDCSIVASGNVTGHHNLIKDSGNTCSFSNGDNNNIVGIDPNLGTLTGSPAYFLLKISSLAINAGDNAVCAAAPVNNTSQSGITRPIGAYCDIGSHESGTEINITIGGTPQGSYLLNSGESDRDSYAGLNNGPVKVEKANLLPVIASERVAYTPDGGTTWTSFDEMMGLPSNQLTDTYYFPYYNNVEMNTQLRFGNVGTSNTVVTVTIGGAVQGSYFVVPNQSMRLSYNLNAGPVKVQSSGGVPIIASIRFANIESTSPLVVPAFTEMMGLPGNQLTTTYVFPYYNNVEMNTQLRFGNVGTTATNVTVTIGGVVQGVYPVAPSQSVRLFYNLNSGPVKVQSSGGVPIIASMRFANIESESPLVISYFSEMLGLPQASLSTNYWFPVYDNVTHNMQLRFGNMGTTSTTVTVRIGGVERGTYTIFPNQSQRLFYTLNDGPVQVQSSGGVPIIASIRFAYIESESPLVIGAFSEMLGLPAAQLSSTYLFPWYNNDELDTQMRIAVP